MEKVVIKTDKRYRRNLFTVYLVLIAVGVAVVIEAQHLCMMMRGVEKQNSVMTTSCVLGEFHNDPSTRAEFFSLIKPCILP